MMIDHTAFLDELVKIGEAAEQQSNEKDRLFNALKAIGIAGLGVAAGTGTAHLVEHAFPAFMHASKPVKPAYVKAVQIGLPILGAMSLSLGNKYRQKLDESMAGIHSNDGGEK